MKLEEHIPENEAAAVYCIDTLKKRTSSASGIPSAVQYVRYPALRLAAEAESMQHAPQREVRDAEWVPLFSSI
jgi:hypothetical protein